MGMPLLPPEKRDCSLSHKEKKTSFFYGKQKAVASFHFSVPLGFFLRKEIYCSDIFMALQSRGEKLFPGLGSLQEFIIMQYAAGLSLKRKAS